MAAVHILIFGEMAGFKIVPFIASCENENFFHGAMKKKKRKKKKKKKKKKISQSELASLHENN